MYTRNIDYIYTLIDAYNCFRTAFLLCMYCDVYMDYKDIPDDHFSYHRNVFFSFAIVVRSLPNLFPITPKETFS